MAKDRYTAVWVSHSSIGDFLACPKAYFLKNVYKDPRTNHKIQIVTPPLSLGQTVHDVLESLSVLDTKRRFEEPIIEKFNKSWEKVSGKRGGFFDRETENRYKERGQEMIRRVNENRGPLAKLAVKIKDDLPSYWISDSDNIILCGKIDWIEHLPETDGVHIIDFKTSRSEESGESLQLPIYHLLVHNLQKRKVEKASYWYLERNNEPTEMKLPDLEESHDKVLKIAKKMKLARQLQSFACPQGKDGCRHCRPFEQVLAGKAELVGTDKMNRDIYVLEGTRQSGQEEDNEVLL